MTNPTPAELISRPQAAEELIRFTRSRRHYIAAAGPATASSLARALRVLSGWTAYFDPGLPLVTKTHDPNAILLVGIFDLPLVAAIPKRITRPTLKAALDITDMPRGRDILLLGDSNDRTEVPQLLVDITERLDPHAANTLFRNQAV